MDQVYPRITVVQSDLAMTGFGRGRVVGPNMN